MKTLGLLLMIIRVFAAFIIYPVNTILSGIGLRVLHLGWGWKSAHETALHILNGTLKETDKSYQDSLKFRSTNEYKNSNATMSKYLLGVSHNAMKSSFKFYRWAFLPYLNRSDVKDSNITWM